MGRQGSKSEQVTKGQVFVTLKSACIKNTQSSTIGSGATFNKLVPICALIQGCILSAPLYCFSPSQKISDDMPEKVRSNSPNNKDCIKGIILRRLNANCSAAATHELPQSTRWIITSRGLRLMHCGSCLAAATNLKVAAVIHEPLSTSHYPRGSSWIVARALQQSCNARSAAAAAAGVGRI